MKKLLLIFVACIIGISVTGCVGSRHNLSDEEIIERIQTKMKKEFDKLNFTVDFNQYEFNVKVIQSFGEVGEVTVKDKRYNYDPVVVYDGAFGNTDKNIGLDQEKIGTNPAIFVYHAYLNYLDEMSKETHQFVQKYLDERGIKNQKGKYRIKHFMGALYPFSLEIVNGVPQRNDMDKNAVFLWEKPKMTNEEYVQYYKNKDVKNIDYNDYDITMSKGTLYYYVVKNQDNYLELEREINQLRPQARFFIQIANDREM